MPTLWLLVQMVNYTPGVVEDVDSWVILTLRQCQRMKMGVRTNQNLSWFQHWEQWRWRRLHVGRRIRLLCWVMGICIHGEQVLVGSWDIRIRVVSLLMKMGIRFSLYQGVFMRLSIFSWFMQVVGMFIQWSWPRRVKSTASVVDHADSLDSVTYLNYHLT